MLNEIGNGIGNGGSILFNQHLTRQADIIDGMRLGQPVVIVGVGATGSFSALCLAKMGATNITVFDPDEVSIENLNCQFYRKRDIGLAKVDALKALIQDFTDVLITTNPVAFNDAIPDEEMSRLLNGAYLLCCADDMDVRNFCLEMATKHGASLLIDPRMGAEKYSQYAITNPASPENKRTLDSYKKSLYSNEDAVQVACTAKSTIYAAIGAASLIVKTVKNVLMEESYPTITHWDLKLSQNSMIMFSNENKKPKTNAQERAESEV